jgi:hypothetical protein
MKADVIFYQNSASVISRFISKLTKSPYTHVAIVVSDEVKDGTVEIMEANRFIKVRRIALALNPCIHHIYRVPVLTPYQRDLISLTVSKQAGKPYDYLQIMGWFLRLVFNIKRDNLFNHANLPICSELIDKAFNEAGVKRKPYPWVGDVTPQHLLDVYNFEEVPFSEFN